MSSIVAVVLCVDADVVCSKMHVGIGRHWSAFSSRHKKRSLGITEIKGHDPTFQSPITLSHYSIIIK